MKRRTKRVILAVAAVLAVIIVMYFKVGYFSIIQGTSMAPNLDTYDIAYVDRIAVSIYKANKTGIQRGDLVVFSDPTGIDGNLGKRVIGLPGETVEFDGGKLYINGQETEEPYDILLPVGYRIHEVQLGEDEFFVLGDNRFNSKDSSSIGPISAEDLIGIIHPLLKI